MTSLKRAVAVVPQQTLPDRRVEPRAPRDEEIHASVIVEIGLDQVLAAQLLEQPGLLGPLLERAVALVSVESHGHRGIKGRRGEIEQAVVIEVFHDRAAGHVESVDLGQMADVTELADVEFGFEEMIDRDQEPGIDLGRILTQSHVGHVQQPAHVVIIGELLEILGEVADGQTRTRGRSVWTAAGAIGRMHELSPRHMTQLSVSPRRSAVTPWKIDERVKTLLPPGHRLARPSTALAPEPRRPASARLRN